jgi:hypothetical protein
MVWVKARGATNDPKVTDAVRGVEEALTPSATTLETTYDQGLLAFGADGFTVGTDDHFDSTTGSGMVAWSWLGGNAISGTGDFTQGVIPSTCSRSVNSGISIVSYAGTGGLGTKTIGHGLSAAPELVIIKCRSASHSWAVGSTKGMDFTDFLFLDTDDVVRTDDTYFGNADPTASVFSVATADQTNAYADPGATYIAYCFHSVEGYSKIGSYEGNNNADGTFIYTGFRPAWIMIKNLDSAQPWMMSDDKRSTYNVVTADLQANNANAESTGSLSIDYVSNGFKCRTTNVTMNAANTYMYLAYAEYPFKYAPAR